VTQNHTLLDLSHRIQIYPADVFHLFAHYLRMAIEIANTLNGGGGVHPTINTELAF
jgi:hypothetical protein